MSKKVCTKCNEEKNLTEYSKDKSRKDGRQATCKECRNAITKKWREENPEYNKKWREENSEYDKKYRQDNPEKVKARHKKYREANPEKVKARRKKYREENLDKVKAREKKYKQENPEKGRATTKKWREKNPEYNKKYYKKYREENPEKVAASLKKWQQKNPDKVRLINAKRRAQKRNTQVENITVKLLNEHWIQEGIDPEKCYYCDDGLYEHLEHCTPLSRGGTHTKENLVPSCAYCNLSKGTKTRDEWLVSRTTTTTTTTTTTVSFKEKLK